ncbi:MAG: ImmA/IrrE family metallo-endopeptidase [Spirochaetales bacterium]|nr:ImmA/IrrE family metallo-endopeptidase [Spirochaetales bacterium]
MKLSIKPELLRWACVRSGYETTSLSKNFPKLNAWLDESLQPTFKQLERFAKTVHAPVGYFFLPEPPVETVPIPDFRTKRNVSVNRPSPDLLDTIYLCQQRQEWYKDYTLVSGEHELDFIGSSSPNNPIAEAAEKIRAATGFSLQEQCACHTWTDALRRFIERVDSIGVLVMTSGIVGSNSHRKLNPDEFRGFALADSHAPLIFINGADTKSAQMFTLAHELAHLWLGQSALSDTELSDTPSNEVERWCNAVAAEFLVPMEDLKKSLIDGETTRETLDRLARHFKVSTLVILRRLHDAGKLDSAEYWTEYRTELDRLKELTKTSGGNFYTTTTSRVGNRFTRAMVGSAWEGRTSFTEACRLLGFKKMSTFKEMSIRLGIGA